MTQIVAWTLVGLLMAALSPASGAGPHSSHLLDPLDEDRIMGQVHQPVELEERSGSLPSTVPVGGLFGNDAGCDAGGTTRYAQEGTPSSGCTYTRHQFGVHYTAIRCLQPCFTAIWNSGVWFSAAEVSCGASGLALVDWGEGTINNLHGDCNASFFGDRPTEYDNWWSPGNGKWSHTDNLADALFHLGA